MIAYEDESIIVLDVGSSSVKAGFSGEDTPRVVFPSVAEDLDLTPEELSTYRARRPEVIHRSSISTKSYLRGFSLFSIGYTGSIEGRMTNCCSTEPVLDTRDK